MDDYREYLVEPLRDLIRLFRESKIPYALMGGMAVSVHGIPRPTHDLDFTIAIERERLPEFYAAVEELGYSVPDVHQSGWVDLVAGMPLVRVRQWVDDKVIDIDLFLAESSFQESLLSRRVELVVEGNLAWVVTPEDLMLLKLIAGRPRDLGDIQDILLAQGQLDEEYLKTWSQRLGVTDRLYDALKLYDELT
jgi:predicted nucleotidyltransferase